MTLQHTLSNPFRWQTLDSGIDVLDFCYDLQSTAPAPAEFMLPPPTPDRDYKIPVETKEQFGRFIAHLELHRAPEKLLKGPPADTSIQTVALLSLDMFSALPLEEQVAISEYLKRVSKLKPEERDVDTALWRWGWVRPVVMRIGRVLVFTVREFFDHPHLTYPISTLCEALAMFVTRYGEYYALDRYPFGRHADEKWREELGKRLRAHLRRDSASLIEFVDMLQDGEYGIHPTLVAHVKWVKAETGREAEAVAANQKLADVGSRVIAGGIKGRQSGGRTMAANPNVVMDYYKNLRQAGQAPAIALDRTIEHFGISRTTFYNYKNQSRNSGK